MLIYFWITFLQFAEVKGIKSSSIRPYLNVVTIEEWPFIMKTRKNGSLQLEGFCVDLLNKILDGESISYSAHFVKENIYGDNSTGLIGDLIAGNSDVVLAPMTITNSRSSFLAFSHPYMDSQLGFVVIKAVQDPAWFGFLKIFDYETWLMLFITLLAFSALFYDLLKFKVSNGEESFLDCVFYAISVISTNGPTFSTKNLSSKILSACMRCFGLIFTTAFTANLTAVMVRNDLVKVPLSIEDILRFPEYSVVITKNDAIYAAFENTTYDPFISLFHKMSQSTEPSFFDSVQEAIDYLRKHPHNILINEVNLLKQHVQNPPCDLVLTRSHYSPEAGGGYGLAVRPEDAKLRDLFSRKIVYLKQSGELANLRRKWFQFMNKCPNEAMSSTISYNYFIGAFLLMICGSVLSILIKIKEIAKFKNSKFPTFLKKQNSNNSTL